MAHYAHLAQAHALLEAEEGTLFKEAPWRVVLAYPSPYHVGMSSLGFQTIYRELHEHPDVSVERTFLPDDLDAFRKARAPLFTLEKQRQASDCEVMAFSVAYELELAGMFEMLELSGLKLLREERSDKDPLIVAGGPLTFSNPDPLEPFIDVLVQGEAESLIHAVMDEVK